MTDCLFVVNLEVRCVQGLYLWRNSSSGVNDELYKGYQKGNSEGKINEITAGCSIKSLRVICAKYLCK